MREVERKLNRLALIGSSAGYWLALLVMGVAMQGIALYYQYGLEYYPCVLCIHVRIWVLGLVAVALVALLIRRYRAGLVLAYVLTFVVAAGLLERSWMLLGIERGTVEGDCTFDAGLPAWFALDKWFPAMFGVEESCGYTPELLFGITMAEGLVVLAAALVLITATLLFTTLAGRSLR